LTLQPEDRDDERVEGAEDTTLILQAADNGGSEVGFSQLLPRSGHVAQLYYSHKQKMVCAHPLSGFLNWGPL